MKKSILFHLIFLFLLGQSNTSLNAHIQPNITCILAAPSNLGYTVLSSSSLQLSWSVNNDAYGYQVKVYQGNTLIQTLTTNNTSITVTGLSRGLVYQFELASMCTESSVSENVITMEIVL
jgi:hypothetical protein